MFSELFAPVSIGVRTIAKTVRILERNQEKGRRVYLYSFERKRHYANSASIGQTTSCGATWALDKLLSQSPIGEALKCFFPQRTDYLKILSIAYFIILNQDNNISKYEVFA